MSLKDILSDFIFSHLRLDISTTIFFIEKKNKDLEIIFQDHFISAKSGAFNAHNACVHQLVFRTFLKLSRAALKTPIRMRT